MKKLLICICEFNNNKDKTMDKSKKNKIKEIVRKIPLATTIAKPILKFIKTVKVCQVCQVSLDYP